VVHELPLQCWKIKVLQIVPWFLWSMNLKPKPTTTKNTQQTKYEKQKKQIKRNLKTKPGEGICEQRVVSLVWELVGPLPV